MPLSPPLRLWKQKQWEKEGCHCPLHRDYGNRNNRRRKEAISPSMEIMETETIGEGRMPLPPPWRLWKQKQWEKEGCNCPLHRDYGNRNNGRRNDAIAPSIEIVETETMGGAQEGERPLQRGYGNRNNGRSSWGRAPPPVQGECGNGNNGRREGSPFIVIV